MKRIVLSVMAAVLAVTVMACGKSPTSPDKSETLTPREVAVMYYTLNLARSANGYVLPVGTGNPNVGLRDPVSNPDSITQLEIRNWSCVDPNDPDPDTAFTSDYANYGNAAYGIENSAVTKWPPIKGCGDKYEFQIYVHTFHRGAANPLLFEKYDYLITEPQGLSRITSISAKRLMRGIVGEISRLPLASQSVLAEHMKYQAQNMRMR